MTRVKEKKEGVTHALPGEAAYPAHQLFVGYGGDMPAKKEVKGESEATSPPAGAGLSVAMGPRTAFVLTIKAEKSNSRVEKWPVFNIVVMVNDKKDRNTTQEKARSYTKPSKIVGLDGGERRP